MASVLKRELFVSVQFLLIVHIALIAAFVGMLPGGGDGELAVTVNVSEAWKNIDPYVKSVLLTFSVLSVLRLAVIFLAHSIEKRMG